MNVKKILCLLAFLLPLFAMLVVLWNNSTTSEARDPNAIVGSWQREYIEGKQVLYRVHQSFEGCEVIDTLINTGREKDLDLAPGKLSRVEYLKTLMVAHCIDYTSADTADILYSDVADDDLRAKQIIKTATDLGIVNGYEVDGKQLFRPNQEITKIEALAILFKLTKFQLKNTPPENNYRDVPNDWKADVANKANYLGIIHSNQVKRLFYPNEKMREGTTYKMLKEVAKYYR